MIGPGIYDAETTRLRERTQARGVIVLVLEGDRGTGLSVQASPYIQLSLPAILRDAANSIERDLPQVLKDVGMGKTPEVTGD